MRIRSLGTLLLSLSMIMVFFGLDVVAEEIPSAWVGTTEIASGAEPDGTEGFSTSVSPTPPSSEVSAVSPSDTASSTETASETADSSETAAVETAQLEGVIDVDGYLNIRSGPWGKIIGSLHTSDKVSIISKEGDWFKILRGTEIAYIHSYYVDAPGYPSHQGIEPPSGVGSDQTPGGETTAVAAGGGDALLGYLQQAGLTGEALKMAWAIGMAESGGDPTAYNGDSSTGDQSYGLFQINMLGDLGPARLAQYGLSSNDELFDPTVNIRVMIEMSGNCTDWSPWSTYNRGDYEEFLGQFPQ